MTKFEQLCARLHIAAWDTEAQAKNPAIVSFVNNFQSSLYVPEALIAKLDMTETTDDGREAGFEVAEEIPLSDLYATSEEEVLDV